MKTTKNANETAGVGHNSDVKTLLKSIVSRIEKLLEEKKSISNDIKEVFAEANANGLNPKVIKRCIRDNAQSKDDVATFEFEVAAYKKALGMQLNLFDEDSINAQVGFLTHR